MALSARHPEFLAQLDIWETMRDCYEGERAIKAKGLRYLPATTGQLLDGLMTSAQSDGAQAYEAYKLRASFPSFTKEATESLLGILHRKDAIVRVPEVLQPFLKRMTREGESVQMLLRRLNTQQILMGRIGVLRCSLRRGDHCQLGQ